MSRRLLPLLEPLHPLFVEEPVLPEHSGHLRSLVRVHDASRSPPANGSTPAGTSATVLAGGIAVAQPDLSHAGGISEVRRIAALAETYDVTVAPHCPLGPIALAASLQVAFATPNFLIQEQSLGIHYNSGDDLLDYLVDPSPSASQDGHAVAVRPARASASSRRGRGTRGRRDRPPLAQPGLAARRRLVRRVVTTVRPPHPTHKESSLP